MELPKTFLYGAALGAHQVEGEDFESDWWRWEQRPSRIHDGETSERGAGHFTRYKSDLDLARKLGHNAVLLTLSWPRIHPESDRFDREALTHYRNVVSHARACGLTPICVLHQVTQPAWFSARGGWCASDSASIFQTYVQEVIDALGNLCSWWIPVYEPEHWLNHVYSERRWPGWESGGFAGYRKAGRQLAAAQRLTATVIHERYPDAKVGVSVRGTAVTPLDPDSPWDTRAAQYTQDRLNMRFIETAQNCKEGDPQFMDFIGLSFSGTQRIRFAPMHLRRGCTLPVDEYGKSSASDTTQINASGLDEILSIFSHFHKPILLTGIGTNTDDDSIRCSFLRDHVETLICNMQRSGDGLDVRALLYASLLDGFEWHHGYTHRCGLVHVKHPGLERTPNPSAWFFKDIAEHGSVRPGAVDKFCVKEQGGKV